MAKLEEKVVIQLSLQHPIFDHLFHTKTDLHFVGKYVVTEVGNRSERADSNSCLFFVVGLSIT
jgi:hypothetical protein